MSKKEIANKKLERDYELYYINLHRFCKLKLKNQEQADDCVQESFYILYKHYIKNEEIKNVAGFLYKIANNLIKEQWRENQKAQNVISIDSIAEIVPAEENTCGELDYDLLAENLVLMLNENERIIYKLKYVENMSIKEIAEKLGLSFDVTAKRLSRLRQKIKDEIKKQFEGGDEF